MMRIRSLVTAAGFAALAGLALSAPASAAPTLNVPARAGSLVDKVELVVTCRETRSGRRRCRTVYVNPYKYNNPNRHPVGSTEWWRAMDRNGSGGYRR